jgi:hypothetical protein
MHQKVTVPHGTISARLLAPCIFTAAALAMSACSHKDLPVGDLRVANAIADSTDLDATVENVPSGITNITFGIASGFKVVPDGSYDVHLTAAKADTTQVHFDADSTHIDRGHATTVYAIGRLSSASQAVFVVEADEPEIQGGQSEVQLVHVASQHPVALDFFVTAPGASLAGATPITLSFPSDGQLFPSNTQPTTSFPPTVAGYEIRVTAHGTLVPVIYDSGPTGVQFPSATTQQFALLDNADLTSTSPPFLLVLMGDGGSFTIANAP